MNSNEIMLNEIHEFCIRNILSEQAVGFYNSFFIEELRPKLTDFFIRMEQFKREDRYEEFCLAIFQQIETIVNFLFEKHNMQAYIENNLKEAVRIRYDTSTAGYIRFGNDSIRTLIFFKNDMKWSATSKLRTVLYLNYFKRNIGFDLALFSQKATIGTEINNMRSLVHGGGFLYENQQIIVDLSISNKYRNYIKLSGFLEDFVSNLSNETSYL